MCGILVISDKSLNKINAINSLKILEKRGPDYTHYDIIDNLFIGQTTLEISGKYNKNNFFSESKNFQISFNGEIYNSNLENDTKYLINQFDYNSYLEIINELDGMYCFSVYDKINNNLINARDIIGEKTMYYYNENNIFILSSEIYPIINYLQEYQLDDQELHNYFLTRHLLQFENTLFKNIYSFLPGESFIFDLDDLTIKNRNINNITSLICDKKQKELESKSSEELNIMLNKIFDKIIPTMIPKIDFACVVSGGIDSSLSTALISKYKKPKLCVCCYCESKDFIANKDMSIYEKSIDNKIDVLEIDSKKWSEYVVKCQKGFSSPLITHSSVNYCIMSEYVAKNKIKVLFVGDGADELFGGYDCYLNENKEFNLYCPSNYSKIYDFKINFLKKYNSVSGIENKLSNLWNECKKVFTDNNQNMLLNDCLTMLPLIGCKTTDTIGSMNGIEIRNIFYRKELLKFILNCPINCKIDFERRITKKLLKSVYLQFYPESTIVKKQGFSGFPNESSFLVENKFDKIINLLKINNYDLNDRDLMWKLINSEIFLKITMNDMLNPTDSAESIQLDKIY